MLIILKRDVHSARSATPFLTEGKATAETKASAECSDVSSWTLGKRKGWDVLK